MIGKPKPFLPSNGWHIFISKNILPLVETKFYRFLWTHIYFIGIVYSVQRIKFYQKYLSFYVDERLIELELNNKNEFLEFYERFQTKVKKNGRPWRYRAHSLGTKTRCTSFYTNGLCLKICLKFNHQQQIPPWTAFSSITLN